MSAIYFNETQRFRTKWAWTLIIALNLVFGYALVTQVFLKQPFGPKPAPDAVLILIAVVLLCLLFFIGSIKLSTSIDESGIHYRFSPFQFKTTHIAWHELRDAYMRSYNSLYEYGGWGIRIGSPKTGRAINTSQSCSEGLQLQFTNGQLLLIGTAKPDELAAVIAEAMKMGKINRHV